MSINFVNTRWIRSVTRIVSIILLRRRHREWLFRGKLIIITLSISVRLSSSIFTIHQWPWVIQSLFLRRFSMTLLFLNYCHWCLGSLFHILRFESWIMIVIEVHVSIFVVILRLLFPLGMLLLIVANIVVNLVINTLHYHSFLSIHLAFSSTSIIVTLDFYPANIPLFFTIFKMNSWSNYATWLLWWNI
jgi:hypothetical protein